jgi:hypothetical protein
VPRCSVSQGHVGQHQPGPEQAGRLLQIGHGIVAVTARTRTPSRRGPVRQHHVELQSR